jgi:hypothetical protein
MTLPDGKLRLCNSRRKPVNLVKMSSFRLTSIGNNLAALLTEVLSESSDFLMAVECFDGLLERDGDEQTDDNGRMRWTLD